MPSYSIKLPHSKIAHLTIQFTAHEAGVFNLQFHPAVQKNEIDKLRGELFPICKQLLTLLGNTLPIRDVIYLRPIIGCLVAKGYIHDNDRPILGKLLQEVEKALEQRQHLSSSSTQSQKDILIATAEVYIDDIIEQSATYNTAIILLRLSFWQHTLIQHRDVQRFIVEKKIEKTTFDSVIALWKICNGEANLESTFARHSNNQVTYIQAQRINIFKACLGKLKKKFSNLDDENNLYMIVGLYLFLDQTQDLVPYSDTNGIIANALSHMNPPPQLQALFKPNIITVICGVGFRYMELLPPEGENKKRIEALQARFNSSLLEAYE